MSGIKTIVSLGIVAVAVATTIGCSKRPTEDQSRIDELAKEKVVLMQRLADEVAKNPNGVDVAGLTEQFLTLPLDVKKYPAEAAEILKIYNERVKGKVRGEVGATLQAAVNQVQAPTGQK